jgi:hypothetical protein
VRINDTMTSDAVREAAYGYRPERETETAVAGAKRDT